MTDRQNNVKQLFHIVPTFDYHLNWVRVLLHKFEIHLIFIVNSIQKYNVTNY